MKITSLNDTMIALMKVEDRKRLGIQSASEAQASFVARSEKELQQQIAALLRLRGIPFYQSRMDRKTTGVVGWMDFTLCYQGLFVGWEVKLPGRSLDPAQVKMRDAITAHGGIWALITSVESARTHLDQLKK